MNFRSTIRTSGKTAAGIPVPDKIIEALAAGRKPAVRVTVNGFTFRTTVGTVSGKYMIPISAERREAAGVDGGETVDVQIELDTAPRVLAVPPALKKLLAKNPAAARHFETLSYSGKQRYVLPIEQAKTEETRERRLTKAIADLAAGKR